MNDYIIVMDKFGGAHLEHRAHKYTKREWQGKGWRYWYGTQYKKDAENARRRSEMARQNAEYTRKDAGRRSNFGDPNDVHKKRYYQSYQNTLRGYGDQFAKESAEWARTAYNSQKLYEKSLAGRIEKGKKIIDSLLSKLKKKVNETAISAGKKLGLKTQQVETRTDISSGQKWRRVNGGPWEKVK